ncbi:FliH/SctL family protein [Ramlibacter sp. PS3R-8]|uniref:FliH/SctL family protein n=1 Tax=Ramlibacter sp. PS3R-8 TaxID=3133437 RepID=UPI003095DDB9
MDDAVFRGMPVDAVPLRLRRAPVVADHGDAGARAEQTLRDAASAGFAEGVRQGRAEGLASGHEEGLRIGQEEAQRQAGEAATRAVTSATAALVEERARLLALARSWDGMWAQASSLVEDDLIALCYQAICRIVGEVAFHPESVRAALVQAMAAAGDAPRLLLRVHPADAALLDRAGVAGAPGQSIAWRGDPEVALGGSILESGSGGLDARLETLLAGCKAALLMAREARAEQASAGAGGTP